MALLSSAWARYLFGSQIKTIRIKEEAEMMRVEFEESGCWCMTRAMIDVI
jgi:hypothetical protein